MASAVVSIVSRGSERIGLCTGCLGLIDYCDLVGLTDAGPIVLGQMIECWGCGSGFRCGFCGFSTEMTGKAAAEHLRTHSDD